MEFGALADRATQCFAQGNRVKASSGDEACEKIVVPAGGFAL
jgi:hypothetical protein